TEDINEDVFTQHTCASELPAVDLLIRTGGEQRISNFLLWQVAYAELYFCNDYWPDFNESSFQAAVDNFSDRQRRFGKTSEQVS
ncbi:undecaprenyl diphosphate synthase family protein, partial [Paraglaciecola sp.]|uniref:undecaprenyl diphosphate synthase family protein n=1 Tax=Paraglaciecola sp. TaxID=1920173 RepID=UPI003EF8A2DC